MNIPPGEAKALSLYDYEAILWNWNDAMNRDELDAPDPEVTMKLIDRINADPRMTGTAKPEPVN